MVDFFMTLLKVAKLMIIGAGIAGMLYMGLAIALLGGAEEKRLAGEHRDFSFTQKG